MSLPVDLPTEGESAFADFLTRLTPYPPPPGFRAALLYGAGGAACAMIAAGILWALPTSVEGDGFHALLVPQLDAVLEFFRSLKVPFAVIGLAGLTATLVIAICRRVAPVAGAILVSLPVIGGIALLWALLGWSAWALVGFVNLAAWALGIGLGGWGVFRAVTGNPLLGICALVVSVIIVQAMSRAASDSGSSSPSTQVATEAPSSRTPAQDEPQSDQRLPPPPTAAATPLAPRRIGLEARLDTEYRKWQQVPYPPPCDHSMRRAELGSLHEQFQAMAQALRTAERTGVRSVFSQVARDLARVAQEREGARRNPRGFYARYQRCPGAGAMRFSW
ncbi:MAG: hypothetical protein ACTHKT_14500 [Solirubrobacterales bacterium]